MMTDIELEYDGTVVATTVEDLEAVAADLMFPGMPVTPQMIEVSITGKDGWFSFPKGHADIRVGLEVTLTVAAHVSEVGIRESRKEGEEDVPFVRLKAELIDSAEGHDSWRAYPKDVRDE